MQALSIVFERGRARLVKKLTSIKSVMGEGAHDTSFIFNLDFTGLFFYSISHIVLRKERVSTPCYSFFVSKIKNAATYSGGGAPHPRVPLLC